ncbi:MAG TPA: DUF4249 domain-containing protein [Bacteroidales bacterium]
MMNKHNIYIPALSLVLLLSWGCTEKIDLKLDSSYTRLVVEGAISTDTMPQQVKLTATSSYFYNEPAPNVTGATVTISDGENTWPLAETTPGLYQTSPDVFGRPNHTYKLEILLKEPVNGHSTYEASSLLRPIVKADSIRLKFHPDWGKEGFYEVQCYVLDPPTTDFYMFDIYRNSTLVTDTIDKKTVVDDQLYNGNYTNGIGVGFLNQARADQRLIPGDIVTLKVASITSDYFKFIQAVQTEVGGQNPLFSGPPANIPGNISNGAVGFFAAYANTRASAVLKKE